MRDQGRIQGLGNPAMAPTSSFFMDIVPLQRMGKGVSLNFSNFCDNFVKKVVFEIRKCRHLQGTSSPLPPAHNHHHYLRFLKKDTGTKKRIPHDNRVSLRKYTTSQT